MTTLPQTNPTHRALTLWQPYATLAAAGVKKIETRPWKTPYRGLLFIHAGKYRDDACTSLAWKHKDIFESLGFETRHPDWVNQLPRGAVIGAVNLVGYETTVDTIERGISDNEKSLGNYDPDRFGLHLTDAVLFKTPVPCVGKQGLFTLPDDILTTAMAALHAVGDEVAVAKLLAGTVAEAA